MLDSSLLPLSFARTLNFACSKSTRCKPALKIHKVKEDKFVNKMNRQIQEMCRVFKGKKYRFQQVFLCLYSFFFSFERVIKFDT